MSIDERSPAAAPIDTGSRGEADFPDAAVVRRPRRHGHIDWVLWASALWIAIAVVAAVTADLLPLTSPTEGDYERLSQLPTAQHVLGTDALGRDILSRVIYGARVSLVVGVLSVVVAMTGGGLLGLLAGFSRGRTDRFIMSLADAALAFPPIIVLMVIMAVRGQSMTNLVLGLGIVYIPTFVRLSRANTLVFMQREFILAARALGAKSSRVMLREVLPNVVPPVAAYAFIVMAMLIVAEGSLSFLGLGTPPPTPSWGAMIAAGRTDLATAPHISLVPAAIMFMTVLAFNMLGDRLRERLNVRETSL